MSPSINHIEPRFPSKNVGFVSFEQLTSLRAISSTSQSPLGLSKIQI
jgi:hypothetical protein